VAHIRKAEGGWRVEVARKGVRKSATLPTKSAATQWAAQAEAEILSGALSRWPRKTVADALDRYEAEVTVNKRGARAEKLRLVAFARDYPALCSTVISEVTTADLAACMPDWVTPIQNMNRVTTTDVEIRGVTIPAGAQVLMCYNSANRDEDVFTDPFRFDVTRNPNPHIAFGWGPHLCLGAALARLQDICAADGSLSIAAALRALN
jgi:hypothetical protein